MAKRVLFALLKFDTGFFFKIKLDVFLQVWISYAKFEHSIDEEGNVVKAREVYQKGNKELKEEDKQMRLMLLQSWKDFEKEFGSPESLEKVEKLMPQKLTKRQQITENGQTAWQEYVDYLFPEDEVASCSLL